MGIVDIFPFLDALWNFFSSDIYNLITQAFAAFVEWSTLQSIKFTLASAQFAWGVADTILDDLSISANLDSAWAALPADIDEMLKFFKVPEAISLITSSFATRYVLKFVPFSGVS